MMRYIAFSALLGLPLLGEAQDAPQINLNSKSEYNAPVINIRSKYDFEQSISLKLKTDPALSAPEALIKAISKYNMVDANGVKVTSGFDVDMQQNLIVSYSGGTSEIIKTAGSPGHIQVTASFKDSAGNFVSPPPDSLAVYSTTGEKLCFDYTTIQQAPPQIAVTILLDHSGSMASSITDVKKAAHDFLNVMPQSAQCAVGTFTAEVKYGHDKYQSCSASGFGFDGVEAGGGTDIYKALESSYTSLNTSYFNGYQKAVIVVTDGYTLSDQAFKQKLASMKKDVLTMVYFIGGAKKDDLEGITDHFVAQGSNVAKSLKSYFGAISTGYNTQKVLSVKACGKGNAAP